MPYLLVIHYVNIDKDCETGELVPYGNFDSKMDVSLDKHKQNQCCQKSEYITSYGVC